LRFRLPTDPRARANTHALAVIAIAVAVVVELWVMVGSAARLAHDAAIDRSQTAAQNIAAAFADSISRTLDGVNASMAIVADKMRAQPNVRPDISAWSHDIPLLSGGVVQASIAGPDGWLASTTLAGETPKIDLNSREHIRVHRDGSYQGLFIGKPIVTQTSSLTVIPVSRRVDSADGKLLGTIIFLLPPDGLTTLLRSIDLGAGGVLTIAGSDDIIRARFTHASAKGTGGSLGQPLAANAISPMVDKATGSYIRKSDIDGIERFFSFRRLPDYPLVVLAGLDTETALSGIDKDASLDITVAGIATTLLFALAAYLIYELRRRAARETELAEQRSKLRTMNNRLKADVALRREAETRLREAQDILRDAVDSVSEAFVIYDAEDRLVMCNDAYRRLYEGSAAILMPGMKFEALLRDGLARGEFVDAIGHEEEWLAARMKTHREPSEPIEAPLGDGRWVLISERRMRNGGTAGLRVDITKLKEAEAQLRESQDRLNRAQRLAQLGSFERNLLTGENIPSDEAYRLLGLKKTDPLPDGEEFLQRIHVEDRLSYKTAIETIESGRPVEPIEYRLQAYDGKNKCIRLEMDVVRDADGQPVRRVGTMQDVTELREIEAQRRELEHQLQHSEKLKALGTLAGGIAHDLNNTLLPILALSELLLRETPPDTGTFGDLDTIVQAARRGRDLVQQILAFSRKEDATKTGVDLAALVRQSLSMLRATMPATINIETTIETVPEILGDAGQLQQVVVNLMTNAAQAIGNDHGTITIGLIAAPPLWPGRNGSGDEWLRLSVADTGCGMDSQTVDRIFEPFFTTKEVGEGTGLGLSVVHGIISAHGGTIEVQSTPGMGSIFTLVVPVPATAEQPVRSPAEAAD
jgi:signal transduction histidine kinase